jgi:5-methylcytosine-specific restriction endonuclease McrA
MRVNLLHAHGSPTRYLSNKGCRCVACLAAVTDHHRRYDAEHRGERIGRMAAWRAANPDKTTAYSAAYYAEHREERLAYNAAYHETHREEIAAGKRAWEAAHQQERRARRDERLGDHAEASKRWRERNPEQRGVDRRNRRAREARASGVHSATDVKTQYVRQEGRCYWCDEETGRHYHVDHVIPLARGGSNGPENIVIACPSCNLRKSAKLPHEFAERMC